MAKVLLCFSSHIYVDNEFKIVSYYEGLIKAFQEHNNQVLVVNTADFLNKPWDGKNKESQFCKVQDIRRDITNFSPDLIISFNNSKLSFLEEEFDCPIVIWEADSFTFYNDRDRIRLNPKRYHYFCLSNNVRKQVLSVGAPENQVHMINSGTAVSCENLEKQHNVSFIGSYFSGPVGLASFLAKEHQEEVKEAINYLSSNFYVEPSRYLKERNMEAVLEYVKPKDFGSISTAHNRNSTLSVMTEFGLALYGTRSWQSIATSLPSLALSFDQTPVYSLKHNQDIYNKSYINLNISHAQAVDGFSWRVMDIMASNGCLLSTENDGLKRFTKGFVDIPMFRSSGEAYMAARKILNDESYRRDIVEGSHACIEEKGRWKHRFKEIEEVIGVSLCDSGDKGEVIYLSRNDYPSSLYSLYAKSVSFADFITPKPLRYPIYLLATKLGFSIDYYQIRSVLEKK